MASGLSIEKVLLSGAPYALQTADLWVQTAQGSSDLRT